MSKCHIPIQLIVRGISITLLASLVIVSVVACSSDAASPTDVEDDFFVRPTLEIEVTFTPVPTYTREAEDCELERGTSCPGADISGLDLGEIKGDSGKDGRVPVRRAADLRDADFTGAIAVGTNLEGARLDGGIFRDANLENANMLSASAYQADFTGANLKGVVLEYVDAEDAIFDGADLTGATLTGANLGNANFTGANLTGADLTDAQIEGAILDEVVFCQTVMPDGSKNDSNCLD